MEATTGDERMAAYAVKITGPYSWLRYLLLSRAFADHDFKRAALAKDASAAADAVCRRIEAQGWIDWLGVRS